MNWKLKLMTLSLSLLPTSGVFACGALSSDAFQGNTAILNEVREQPLGCLQDHLEFDSKVQAFALERCGVNSKVQATMSVMGEQKIVSNITKEGERYFMRIKGQASEVQCMLLAQ